MRASARQTNKHRHSNLITCCYALVNEHTHKHIYLYTVLTATSNCTRTQTDTLVLMHMPVHMLRGRCTHTYTHTQRCYACVTRSSMTVVSVVVFLSAHYLSKQQLSVRTQNRTSVIPKPPERGSWQKLPSSKCPAEVELFCELYFLNWKIMKTCGTAVSNSVRVMIY